MEGSRQKIQTSQAIQPLN